MMWPFIIIVFGAAIAAWSFVMFDSDLLRVQAIHVTMDHPFTSRDGNRIQELLMGFFNESLYVLWRTDLSSIISEFPQVASSSVHIKIDGSVDVRLSIRRPMVSIRSGTVQIALDETAHPFLHESESPELMGILLRPEVESTDLLNPSPELQAFYSASVYLSKNASEPMRQFMILDGSKPNEVRLVNASGTTRIRLGLRAPETCLRRLDDYMKGRAFAPSTEIDLRLTDLMVIRPLKHEPEAFNG